MIIMPRNFGEDKIIKDAQVIPTLDARMGTGGNNVPIILVTDDEKNIQSDKTQKRNNDIRI